MALYRDKVFLDKLIAKIKRTREERGITLAQFYNDTNIHLARIESRKSNISVSILKAISRYFGIPLSEFLKGM